MLPARMTSALALALALAGCGMHATVSEESDPYRVDETYSKSVNLSGQDEFERAQELTLARDFDGAIAIYRNLYRNGENAETRARALLEWARAERNPFNAARDPDAAQARLELLLETYPDTEAAAEARLALDSGS